MRGHLGFDAIGRTESTIISTFLLIVCPASFFVIGWWAIAALYLSEVIPIPERVAAVGAFAGLALGLVLAIGNLGRWRRSFYTVGSALTVPLYLFWSTGAIAFFMGLPIGNLILGSLAGLYVGRRQRWAGAGEALFEAGARRAGVFTATVTGLISSGIGVLAVQEQHGMQRVLGMAGLNALAATPARRAAVVAVAVPVLAAVQYALTSLACRWGHSMGRDAA